MAVITVGNSFELREKYKKKFLCNKTSEYWFIASSMINDIRQKTSTCRYQYGLLKSQTQITKLPRDAELKFSVDLICFFSKETN